jgi:hypothetical protein
VMIMIAIEGLVSGIGDARQESGEDHKLFHGGHRDLMQRS